MKGLYYLFGILCFTYFTDSKPNGAPQDSCFYMTPRHIHPHTYRRVFPTKAMGLYNITTSADVFRPDRPIRVTLWGPPFKGFLLVAAEEGAKDWPTGIFYSESGSAKRLSCLGRGDTVTHQNNSYKDSVSVLWYGPENMMSEQIQFIATVVVNLTIYYTNIRSGMIRLDPTLHGAAGGGAGGEGAPAAVTMDPWLSGQSVTQAPANWWSNLGGGAAGLGGAGAGVGRGLGGSSWGNTASNGWGANTGANTWGSNTGNSAAGGWGSNTANTANTAAGGWGSNTANTAAGGWGSNTANTAAGGWGSNTANTAAGGWGANTGTGAGTGGWGDTQRSGGTGWGSNQNTGWQQRGTGTSANSGNSAWAGPAPNNNQAGGNSWGTTRGTGAGNSWSANGDWQQWGQGSVTSRTLIRAGTQYQTSDGGTTWNNGQTLWNAPGDGRAIWHWNSGKISTTPAPATTQTPKPTQPAGGSGSAWSASDLLNVLQRIGIGGAGTAV